MIWLPGAEPGETWAEMYSEGLLCASGVTMVRLLGAVAEYNHRSNCVAASTVRVPSFRSLAKMKIGLYTKHHEVVQWLAVRQKH